MCSLRAEAVRLPVAATVKKIERWWIFICIQYMAGLPYLHWMDTGDLAHDETPITRWWRISIENGRTNHVLHVRLPLRYQSAPRGRQAALYRGQPGPSREPGGALRQGVRRHHDGDLARAPHDPARARRSA